MANETMGLLGRKLGMTQIFTDEGRSIPVTILETGPCTVLQIKSEDGSDGYNAIQLGFGKAKKPVKAAVGHAKAANTDSPKWIYEIRVTKDQAGKFEVGQVLGPAEVFTEGERVDLSGTSKGRGFAGVFKKFGMAGFERTHGTHEFFRHGGSIGTRLTPGHVTKGRAMPGQYGNKAVTVQNITVARIDNERNLVFLYGGAPGPTGGVVTIRKAVK